jgi:hypothetical protein
MRWNGRPALLAFASIRSKTSVGNRRYTRLVRLVLAVCGAGPWRTS